MSIISDDLLPYNEGRYYGEFNNGKYHGKGVLYLPSGYCIEGEFNDGKCDGKFTVRRRLHQGGLSGEFKDQIFRGTGHITKLGNKLPYNCEGEWISIESNNQSSPHLLNYNFKLHGEGIQKEGNTKREGKFEFGKLQGFGSMIQGVNDASWNWKYSGLFWDSWPHGKGTKVYWSGMRCEGTFEKGKLNGMGLQIIPDEGHYEGEFKDGKPNGKGIFVTTDGKSYEGQFGKSGDKSRTFRLLVKREGSLTRTNRHYWRLFDRLGKKIL